MNIASRHWVPTIVMLLATLLLLAGCGAGLAEDATGEEIYNARCASCHRKDFSGGIGPALGAGSEAVDRPREYYELTILAGIGRMPSFRSTLSEAQVDRVIDYILAAQNAG